ncbi:Methyltransferase type 12 [Shewanella denitrificans OS217]|jgi:predicted TPR repeat methyltransferase|uniref:Methyltransferase type 12 n=1 Tax=Shewanella denitrificans (strain OS217 / ATCC BAA-1090 / DSM 15013) TaxID=318161 RepID=Q12PG7_SHEDO|nr:class I SAM-dependent methyltransferase [Shewanella denitrificans]ABE54659.1 Methyltransferase type 12 [Shewanella denitrificans OS217]
MDKNQQAVALFNQLAQGYQDKYMDVGLYETLLGEFCAQLTHNAWVLDMACGPGNLSRYLLDKRPDIQLLGLELAPNMVALAKQNNPEAEFVQMDCRAIEFNHLSNKTFATRLTGEKTQRFDALICGFVLPYLTPAEVLALFDDMQQLVKDDGIIYLSTMTGKLADSGFQTSSSGQQMFIHYHEEAHLLRALSEAGFEMISHKQQAVSNPSPERQVVDSLFIIKKRP